MAKNVGESVEILNAVSKALLAAKETFVKEKEEKDAVINMAFKIIKRELSYLDKVE